MQRYINSFAKKKQGMLNNDDLCGLKPGEFFQDEAKKEMKLYKEELKKKCNYHLYTIFKSDDLGKDVEVWSYYKKKIRSIGYKYGGELVAEVKNAMLKININKTYNHTTKWDTKNDTLVYQWPKYPDAHE